MATLSNPRPFDPNIWHMFHIHLHCFDCYTCTCSSCSPCSLNWIVTLILIVDCSDPPNVLNAQAVTDHDAVSSTKVSYTCNNSDDKVFLMVGKDFIGCQPDGSWTPTQFSCIGKFAIVLRFCFTTYVLWKGMVRLWIWSEMILLTKYLDNLRPFTKQVKNDKAKHWKKFEADIWKICFGLTFNRMESYHPEDKLVYYKFLKKLFLWRA